MATPSWTENPGLNAPDDRNWEIREELYKEPFRFQFFQAIRLLERINPAAEPVGRFVTPDSEVVRFGVRTHPAFPASQIQELNAGDPPMMRVNFMGLTGPTGVLPLAYTEHVVDRLRSKDTVLRDFFDLFHHRIISLFYQAWEKYRFAIAYERGERDRFSHHLLDLIGLGTAGLQNRQPVSDDSLLFYSGLLGLHTRSAAAFEQILTDYFEVPVAVDQFVGAWYPIDAESQCSFSETMLASEQLGVGAVVGNEIWDQQSRVRIKLGPLTFQQYQDFLPEGSAHAPLRALTSFYAGGEFDVEVQLFLKRDEVPPCELSEPDTGPQLGWTTWVKNADFRRDPGDAVLKMM